MKTPKFDKCNSHQNDFTAELELAVKNYFQQNQSDKYGNNFTTIKAIFLLATYIGAYSILISTSLPPWFFYSIWIGLGIMKALIGMQIGHDACHGTFSKTKGSTTQCLEHLISFLSAVYFGK